MAAVLEAEETATGGNASRMPKQLARYAFQPGHAPINGGGRPKGSKSFSTILVEAAPKIGKAYLREALKGSAPLLADSRKVFMPIESDVAQSATLSVALVGFLETHAATLALASQPSSPTLRMGDSVVAMPTISAPSATVMPSAATGRCDDPASTVSRDALSSSLRMGDSDAEVRSGATLPATVMPPASSETPTPPLGGESILHSPPAARAEKIASPPIAPNHQAYLDSCAEAGVAP